MHDAIIVGEFVRIRTMAMILYDITIWYLLLLIALPEVYPPGGT